VRVCFCEWCLVFAVCSQAFARSGAGRKLKVGEEADVRRKVPEKNFLPCPSTFLALRVQLVVLVSAFVMDSSLQLGQFLVCCFSAHGAPVCLSICQNRQEIVYK